MQYATIWNILTLIKGRLGDNKQALSPKRCPLWGQVANKQNYIMKTYNYKTLRGLLRQCGSRYFTFYDFHSGRFYHKTAGWVRYNLSDSGREEAARLFAGVVWSRANADRVEQCLYYHGRLCGILERLWITKTCKAEYCAGQDYVGEIRCIQGLMR